MQRETGRRGAGRERKRESEKGGREVCVREREGKKEKEGGPVRRILVTPKSTKRFANLKISSVVIMWLLGDSDTPVTTYTYTLSC